MTVTRTRRSSESADHRFVIESPATGDPVAAVVTLIPFSDEDEAVRIANGTQFGLVTGVFTRSNERVLRASRIGHTAGNRDELPRWTAAARVLEE